MASERLTQLVEERQILKAEIEAAQKKIDDELNPQIIIELSLANEKSCVVEALGRKWSTYISETAGRTTYPTMKLIEAGVTPEQLEKAKTVGKGSTSVGVKELDSETEA